MSELPGGPLVSVLVVEKILATVYGEAEVPDL
jgi:hypothetical protein